MARVGADNLEPGRLAAHRPSGACGFTNAAASVGELRAGPQLSGVQTKRSPRFSNLPNPGKGKWMAWTRWPDAAYFASISLRLFCARGASPSNAIVQSGSCTEITE